MRLVENFIDYQILIKNSFITDTLNEAVMTYTGNLITFFAIVIVYCDPHNIKDLYNKFSDNLIDYISQKYKTNINILNDE